MTAIAEALKLPLYDHDNLIYDGENDISPAEIAR